MYNRLNLSSKLTDMYFCINGLGNGLGYNAFDNQDNDNYFCWCLVDLYIKNQFFHFPNLNFIDYNFY